MGAAMTLCVIDGGHCICQPQDGVFCPNAKTDADRCKVAKAYRDIPWDDAIPKGEAERCPLYGRCLEEAATAPAAPVPVTASPDCSSQQCAGEFQKRCMTPWVCDVTGCVLTRPVPNWEEPEEGAP